MTMPGKNPAANDLPSKPDDVLTIGGASVVWDAAGDSVGVGVEDADADGVVDGDALERSAWHIPPLHAYPIGQHLSPHCGRRTAVSFKRWIWLSGCNFALNWPMSHVVGCIKEQSTPLGQQMTDTASVLLTRVQVVSLGQQNSEGRSLPHWTSVSIPPHTASSRRKRLEADMLGIVMASRRDILESLAKPILESIVSMKCV